MLQRLFYAILLFELIGKTNGYVKNNIVIRNGCYNNFKYNNFDECFTVSYTTCTFKATVYFFIFLSNSIVIVDLIQLCEFKCFGQ